MKEKMLNQKPGKINDVRQTITTPLVIRGKQRMNKIYLVVICIIGVLMSSCLVKSLHPFYFESDVVFRKDILGIYTDQQKGTWTIESKEDKPLIKSMKPTKFYLLKLVDEKKRNVTLKGFLFKLDNNYYVDFYLESGNDGCEETDLYNFHVLGVHTVARLIIGKNDLRIKWYNAEWLSNLFKENKIRLAHEKTENDDNVLTASTQELQKFMKKFANDPNAFKNDDKGHYDYVLNRKQ